jgi:hypothetical protein
LGLRILGDVADRGGQLARAGGDRVDAGDVDAALDLAAVEVGDEATGGAEQGRLAAGRAAGQQSKFASRQREGDIAQRETHIGPL